MRRGPKRSRKMSDRSRFMYPLGSIRRKDKSRHSELEEGVGALSSKDYMVCKIIQIDKSQQRKAMRQLGPLRGCAVKAEGREQRNIPFFLVCEEDA